MDPSRLKGKSCKNVLELIVIFGLRMKMDSVKGLL